MKKVLLVIMICYMTCNGVFAQSLGKMTLGCKKTDIPLSLPSGFNICKTNTSNQLTYVKRKDGSEYVSFYLSDNIVYKIVMHKFIGMGASTQQMKSKIEDVFISLCDMWGEPSYIGENIYWQFPASKATFSYNVTSDQFYGLYGIETVYSCDVDIKLEKRTNIFE